jgi:hypothetical protein
MRRLAPSLSVIESNLFDPSTALVRRWSEGDASLSSETRAALEQDSFARTLRDDFEATTADNSADVSTQGDSTIPADFAEAVRLRVANVERRLSAQPRPGLILAVREAMGREGPLGWDLSQPLAVLLSEPTEHPDVWYSWVMSWETDYATWWDVLLEKDDEPYDPSAAMVQVWNPVHLYLPSAGEPLGELSEDRLDAVRAVADDLAVDHPDPAEADPGTLVQRVATGGYPVLTGSPLGDDSDPRHRYHALYFEAAGFVREVARLAEESPREAAAPWWQRVLDRLNSAAGVAGLPLTPEPVSALSSEDAPREDTTAYLLADLVRVRPIPSPQGDAVQLHVSLSGKDPLIVGLEKGGSVRQQETLTPERRETDLFAGTGQGLAFFIRNQAGDTLFSAELEDATE